MKMPEEYRTRSGIFAHEKGDPFGFFLIPSVQNQNKLIKSK